MSIKGELIIFPLSGKPTHIVAQINGFYGGYVHDPFRLFAELLVSTEDEFGVVSPAYYSSGSGCFITHLSKLESKV